MIKRASPILINEILFPFQDIQSKLQNINEINQFPSLYSRYWLSFSSSNSSSNFSSDFQSNLKRNFRIMQFNLLAEGLSSLPSNIPPFNSSNGFEPELSNCGGFDLNEDSQVIFNFNEFRKWKLIEEILRYLPDILAVEECDHFDDFFYPILQSIGYEGVFQPKLNSPSCNFGYYSDGVALFWKTEVFNKISYELSENSENNSSKSTYVIVLLQHISSNEQILVSATHLKAKSSIENEEIRFNQALYILYQIEKIISLTSVSRCLFVGDLNTDCFPIHKSNGIVLSPRVIELLLKWNNSFFSSVYPLPLFGDNQTSYTTWKSRQGKESKHMIDYIFYTHSTLFVEKFLSPPDIEEILQSPTKLPNLRYPSDHIAIVADIKIL